MSLFFCDIIPQMPERIGDMDPKSGLNAFRDASGDVVVQIRGREAVAEVEFCTPGPGGGQSPKTFEALLNVIEAIEEDNNRGRDATPATMIEDSKRRHPQTAVRSYHISNFPSDPE